MQFAARFHSSKYLSMRHHLAGTQSFALVFTAPKMKFSIKDFFSKCDQIRCFLRIRSHLMKKSVMENFIFCAVILPL